MRPPDPADAALSPLPPVETAPPLPVTAHEPARTERAVRHDVISGEVTLDWIQDSGRHRYDDIDLTVHTVAADRFSIRPEDPLSARAEVAWTVRLARGDWRVETRTRTELTATRDTFEVDQRPSRLSRETRRSTRSAGSGRSRAIWSDGRTFGRRARALRAPRTRPMIPARAAS